MALISKKRKLIRIRTMQTLSSRQNNILRGVIETHIETTQPVGSRLIAEKYAFAFSPATIRNEMGTLEELGYLTHPHTSSGRLPTDRGYRYYLDHTAFEDPTEEAAHLDEGLASPMGEDQREAFWDQVSLFLASFSQEVGLALTPSADELPRRVKWSLQGVPSILEKPEFQDVRKVRNLLGVFEERTALTHWVLTHVDPDHVSVSVGREHGHEALEDCAIVTARYTAGDGRQGVLAVLGPKRMAYRRVILLVARAAVRVGTILKTTEF